MAYRITCSTPDNLADRHSGPISATDASRCPAVQMTSSPPSLPVTCMGPLRLRSRSHLCHEVPVEQTMTPFVPLLLQIDTCTCLKPSRTALICYNISYAQVLCHATAQPSWCLCTCCNQQATGCWLSLLAAIRCLFFLLFKPCAPVAASQRLHAPWLSRLHVTLESWLRSPAHIGMNTGST